MRGFIAIVAAFVAALAAMAVAVSCSPAANAEPGTEITLGEFITTQEAWVQTGCVSPYKDKPNYIEFSTFYIGSEDAALQLEHVVNGQWVTSSFEEGLRITVDGDVHDPSRAFVALGGGAHQRFDMTVFNVSPDEVWRLVGGHSHGPLRVLAAWSAAQLNQCASPVKI